MDNVIVVPFREIREELEDKKATRRIIVGLIDRYVNSLADLDGLPKTAKMLREMASKLENYNPSSPNDIAFLMGRAA